MVVGVLLVLLLGVISWIFFWENYMIVIVGFFVVGWSYISSFGI